MTNTPANTAADDSQNFQVSNDEFKSALLLRFPQRVNCTSEAPRCRDARHWIADLWAVALKSNCDDAPRAVPINEWPQ